MPLALSSASISTSSLSDGWVQTYIHIPEDNEVRAQKGVLFATLIEKKAQTLLSKSVFLKLMEYYYSSSDLSSESLKTSISKIRDLIGEIDLVVCSLLENKITCFSVNEGKVLLYRGGLYATLLNGQKTETRSLAGNLKSGDVLILGSESFFEIVTPDMLRVAVPSKSPEELKEFLKPLLKIKNEEEALLYVALLLKVTEEGSSRKESEPVLLPTDDIDESEVVDETGEPEVLDSRSVGLSHYLDKNPMFVVRDRLNLKPFSNISSKKFARDIVPMYKSSLILGVIGVLLLVGCIVFGLQAKEKRAKNEEFTSKLTTIQNKLDESINLSNINPAASRELFNEAKEEVLGISSENEEDTIKLNELKNDIILFQKDVYAEHTATLSLLVDLNLLSDGFTAQSVSSDKSNVYILDTESEKIAKTSIRSSRSEIVAGPGLVSGVYHIATYVDTIYGMRDDGVLLLQPKEEVLEDGYEDALIFLYAGNIYVLDKGSSEIYRYTRGLNEFGSKTKWLSEGITTDISDAKEWVIDGSIWVLKENSTIYRFTNGTYWEFTPSGVFPLLTTITSIYTSDTEEYFYILDSEGKRIVVLTKQGEFKTQYVADELSSARQIVVSEEAKKILVVTSDKVYSMPIE